METSGHVHAHKEPRDATVDSTDPRRVLARPGVTYLADWLSSRFRRPIWKITELPAPIGYAKYKVRATGGR